MKNYKKMKMITTFFLAFMVAWIGFPSVSNAATVGESLTTPEAGWKRYDDTSNSFTFAGTWKSQSDPLTSGGSIHYTDETYATVSFEFVGSQIRIIGSQWYNRSQNITITIDGVSEIFSQHGANNTYQVIHYEKKLSPGTHVVEIKNTSDARMGFDAIDIDTTGYLVNTNLAAPTNLTATGAAESISLNWASVTNPTSYNVKRSRTEDGLYETIATNLTGTTYSDAGVIPGITYYYVVTAINAGGESAPSNIASATIPVPENGRAILLVTMTTGLEKEYDLSMQEVNAFIDWYEAKQEGTGKASYAINKHDNNKGPFKSRKDYILFDRILTFEVSEY